MNPDPLELSRISQESWVDRVRYFETTDSTNNRALEHAEASEESFVELFLAEQQTDGRGRGSNTWWSGPGALTWSLLSRPLDVPIAHLPQVSLSIGAAICDAVEHFVPGDVTLKWPNDVYLNGRKVAGILIERASDPGLRVVIGVGLNVNNSVKDAPAELHDLAIAMTDAVGHPGQLFDRSAVLIECLRQIEQYFDRFLAEDATLSAVWRARSLLTGRQVRIETAKGETVGYCEGLADDGALVLQTDSGTQKCYGGVVTEFV